MLESSSRSPVVVLGGTNNDTFLRVSVLPRPGETVVAHDDAGGLGGKGANQAVAVSRAGGLAVLLSAVGDDDAGRASLSTLAARGVDTSRVIVDRSTPTGRAIVVVDDAGENSIVVSRGANAAITPDLVQKYSQVVAAAGVLVVQGEVSAAASRAAIDVARRAGVRVVLNLAPFGPLADAAEYADPLVLNEVEAGQLLDTSVPDVEAVERHASDLAGLARSVVVTLGAAGAAVVQDGECRHHPAPPSGPVVDTTGAGDAFVGVLAACLAAGLDLDSSCRTAVVAATRTVGVLGAAIAYPAFSLQLDARVSAEAG